MKEGWSIYWLVLMAGVTLLCSILLTNAAKNNRAWMMTAAEAQKQLQQTVEIYKEYQNLSAQLSSLGNSVRLMFRAQAAHLTRYWWEDTSTVNRRRNLGLARYAEPHVKSTNTDLLATGGSW